jgi:hypothetical protein
MYILTVRRAVCSKLDYHFAKFNLTNFTSFTTLLHLHTCKLSKKDFPHLRYCYKIFYKKLFFDQIKTKGCEHFSVACSNRCIRSFANIVRL